MKAILIDDELYCTEVLSSLLSKNCPEVEIVAEFNDSRKALEHLRNAPPDVVFLDIEMPRLNGIDLLQQCRPLQFQVIFTTAYNQYALQAIKLSALDYLLKPIDIEELKEAVKKAKDKTAKPDWRQFEVMDNFAKSPENAPKTIALSTSEGLTFVEVADIVHCQSEGSYTKLFFINNETIMLSKPLKDVSELLVPCGFLRVHHSYLINLKHIKKYIRGEGGEIITRNGHSVPVSKQKKAEFLEKIAKI
ncbi:MAG: response regulator transcription factor [Haliscomenobacter sp.]|nr:LytTR family DNA-binding domain-containing protein [Haliscomenobacter sp.]MBK9491626.1 response regulator transcription factor [Haliscomenobacter sp.]